MSFLNTLSNWYKSRYPTRVTEIRSKSGVLHFRRWRLFESSWFRFYVHEIAQTDQDKHLHNHPWNFASFVVKGGYVELLEGKLANAVHRFQWNAHKAHEYHKVIYLHSDTPTVSLFFAYGRTRPWGYLTREGFIGHELYRSIKNEGKIESLG